MASVSIKRPSENLPNSSLNLSSLRMASLCMPRVTVRPRSWVSAQISTSRDIAPKTSFNSPPLSASSTLLLGRKARRVRSNSTATSRGETETSPAETALSLPPIRPVVPSPMPHKAKPPAKKSRKNFISGDFAPLRNACNILHHPICC